jgi:hypothetical protein
MRLDPNSAFSYNVVATSYLGLNRLAESKAIRQQEIEKKVGNAGDHANLYMFAFLDGDVVGMQREVEWAKGRQDEYAVVETVADVTASSGKMAAARASYQQTVDLWNAGKSLRRLRRPPWRGKPYSKRRWETPKPPEKTP